MLFRSLGVLLAVIAVVYKVHPAFRLTYSPLVVILAFFILGLSVMMPKLNGYEVCQRVREDPEATGIGIVLLTAKGQEVDRRQGLELGASRYMTKPFDPDEVLKVAKELLHLDVKVQGSQNTAV